MTDKVLLQILIFLEVFVISKFDIFHSSLENRYSTGCFCLTCSYTDLSYKNIIAFYFVKLQNPTFNDCNRTL